MKTKPMPHECYEGEILHFIFQVGVEAYLGKWEAHPNNVNGYEGWIRIKDPCVVVTEPILNSRGNPRSDANGPMMQVVVKRVGARMAPPTFVQYEDYKDVYWPVGVPFSLRILKKEPNEDSFYSLYTREISCLYIPGKKEIRTVTDIGVSKN